MSISFKKTLIAASVTSVLVTPAVYATNGMNVEGYGPVATAMGGASMAYDNGTAAVMNNPATLGLMGDGNRLDLALGFLGPDVEASMEHPLAGPLSAKSGGDAFYMPAVGWVKKDGKLTYGVGMFAQGGMGTEYADDSFLAAGTGEEVRSEVGVGRLLAPIAYNVDDKLTVGGTIDFVWAGMDLKMAMSGGQFLDFLSAFGGTESMGTASDHGSSGMLTAFGGAVAGGMINGADPVNTVRFDFSNSSDFTGDATSTGFGAKIGAVYKVNNQLTIGGTYHAKTSLGDMESSGATMSMNANFDTGILAGGAPSGSYVAQNVEMTGKVTVVDFQWPATIGFGAAYQVSDSLMVVADIKQIRWSDVMESFVMTFVADDTQTGLAAGFAGTGVELELFQEWDDQNVIQVGAAYKVDDALTVRGGVNMASNPVPDEYMHPLFPAIEENHITAGVGYKLSDASVIDFSLTMAQGVTQENSNPLSGNVEVEHSQLNWQLMYSMNF